MIEPTIRVAAARCARALLILSVLLSHGAAQAQSAAQGIYNWVHTSGDIDAAYAFYNEVFGVELALSPFYGDPNVRPTAIRPESEAGSDALVWDLTNTHGSRYRSAFLGASNARYGLELVEFFDIERSEREASPWDRGASMLMFAVRDLDTVISRARERNAPIVTPGGTALETPSGRAIVLRNPDGYLFHVTQASPQAIAAARQPGTIIDTRIGITVGDTSASLAFYRDLLGLEVGATRAATEAELRVYGLAGGRLAQTTLTIPGTNAVVVLSEFTLRDNAEAQSTAFQWRIQDIGAPQFQLQVAGLDGLLTRTRQAGYRFLSVGGRPIDRPFGRFVFAIDPDNVLVEYVEPAASR